MLVEAGTHGMPAGALSQKLEMRHNSLSFHLNHLSNAGIVRSRRDGRSIIYYANFDVMHDLIGFLVEDCCRDDLATIQRDKASGCSIIELAASGESTTG